MKLVFIRHGVTEGNKEKRYIGRTDLPLCEEGIEKLKTLSYQPCDVLVCSPMKRCVQTAEILFPNSTPYICDDMRECDFGIFENKNYLELQNSPDYQKWIESGGKAAFPNGESPKGFQDRSAAAFESVIQKFSDKESIVFVVHGGTIMALFEKYAVPKKKFYEWYVENGRGYIVSFESGKFIITEKL